MVNIRIYFRKDGWETEFYQMTCDLEDDIQNIRQNILEKFLETDLCKNFSMKPSINLEIRTKKTVRKNIIIQVSMSEPRAPHVLLQSKKSYTLKNALDIVNNIDKFSDDQIDNFFELKPIDYVHITAIPVFSM